MKVLLRTVINSLSLGLAFALPAASVIAQDQVSVESDPPLVHHSLKVILDPQNQTISVEDTITVPDTMLNSPMYFSLNNNLTISNNSGRLRTLSVDPAIDQPGINNTGGLAAATTSYSISRPRRNSNQLLLIYSGMVYDSAEQTSAEYAQSFAESSGIIGEQGVYLNKGSAWVADFGADLITFDLHVEFVDSADTWTAVSQGDRLGDNGWSSDQPMEEVYLIAADFTEYSQRSDDVEVLAYLRSPDPNLATKYMDATGRYLALYEPLLGEYPYSKFALVENFWETGYGMPSFTLLGEQVIRFPFILESSYPHEILHNWWGNGVYPDYETGNWSEGLTAYLADHLFKEMEGLGFEYRKEMLARYKNYVADAADFPLSEFTSRNSAASQAVGYGKTLMLWHMLRVQLGDELFIAGLRQFYEDYKFKRATFDDIALLFSGLSGVDLSGFFAQWVDRTGAPELSISVEEVIGNRARIMFAQIQREAPYSLKVPVALYYADSDVPEIYDIDISQRLEGVMADNYSQLQAVLVDPYFDVFRTLDREETPPTIGELFGAERLSFVVTQANRQHWMQMAENFSVGVEAEIIYAEDITELPQDRSVWVLGRENPFAQSVIDASELYAVEDTARGLYMAGSEIEYSDRSSVLVTRHPTNPELALGFIHVDQMVAMPGMIEKLPHYGKYSYLSFFGAEPTNDVKGTWSSPDSPLQWVKPNLQAAIDFGKLPAIEPLTQLPSKYMPGQLREHASKLSSAELQGRGLGTSGIDKAAQYIAEQFREAGLQTLNGTYIQEWSQSVAGRGSVKMANIVGMIPGVNRSLSGQPLIIGAHYDHLGLDPQTGRHYPGADDNAAGIAAMIEVASQLARAFSPQRPILFVAFSGEESGLLGSQYFVENPPAGFNTKDIYAMINLDAVGRLEGRDLQVFASDSAYEWPFMAQGIGFTIGVNSTFPTNTIASSDHVNFLNAGIPAIHLFSGAHSDYHRLSDSVDKLDLDGLSDVALWLEEAAVYLADNTQPLRVTLDGAPVVVPANGSGARSASLGTVPDFAYSGNGVRISDVTPGSAAEAAGLQAGDILLNYNDQPMSDLQTYSNLLRQSAIEDVVRLEIRRAEQRLTLEAVLQAR
ncbi:MAG: M20/M25/M40 family metallo-hydrolase [Pseudohongiellaceae bacterium]